MNVEQLAAFLEVASQRSFSGAARSLFITQPALSARIKALEVEVGQALFVRPKGGVHLTEPGARLVPYAERALDLLREGRRVAGEARATSSGRLHLGATLSASAYIVPRLLTEFHTSHPDVTVAVTSAHAAEVLAMVLSGTVQLGITRALQHPGLESVDLYTEELVPVIHSMHPLAKARSVTLARLAEEPNILSRVGSSYHGVVNWAYLQAELVPRVVMNLDSIEAIKKMAISGLGVAFLPKGYIAGDVRAGDLVQLRLEAATSLDQRVVVLYRKGRDIDAISRGFLEIVQRVYATRARRSAPGRSVIRGVRSR